MSRSFSVATTPLAVRETLLGNLQRECNMRSSEIQQVRECIIAADIVELIGQERVGHIGPGIRYYRPNGEEHTLEDVAYPRVLDALEMYIEDNIPFHRRTEVYHRVMNGLPGHKNVPSWEHEIKNPHARPSTRFSEVRPGFEMSNEEMIHKFALACQMSPLGEASLTAQIIQRDGSGDPERPCTMEKFPPHIITGGRLGRDHTLADVPNHYVRDKLMDYATKVFPREGKRHLSRASRRAICPDLSEEEISQYKILVVIKTSRRNNAD